jgi:hypothetical protein
MNKNKVLSVVRMNRSIAFVFKNDIEYTYEEITHKGTRYLVGSDTNNLFFSCLKYERASQYAKAFAGREMTLIMKDGTERVIKDNWWHFDYTDLLEEYYGYETINITYGSYENLNNCYVYTSGNVVSNSMSKLAKKYKNKIFNYYEGEYCLFGRMEWRKEPLSDEEQIKYMKILKGI